jgi:hypothetical protein
MPAAVYRMTVEQGATFEQVFTFTDLDLTGYTGRGQIRETTAEATALADFTVTIAGGTDSTVTVTLPASELSALDLTGTTNHTSYIDAAYDIEAVSGTTVVRLLNGVARISPNATR